MTESDNQLAHSIKIRFRTSPWEPTEQQLEQIKQAIRRLGRPATEADWASIVGSVCPSAGKYVYGGLDNSDLNALLAQASKTN